MYFSCLTFTIYYIKMFIIHEVLRKSIIILGEKYIDCNFKLIKVLNVWHTKPLTFHK